MTEDQWGLYSSIPKKEGLQREVFLARHKVDFLKVDTDLTETALLYALNACKDNGWEPETVHCKHEGMYYTRTVAKHFGLGFAYLKGNDNDRWWVECTDGYKVASRGA
jgi:hypothetical protein